MMPVVASKAVAIAPDATYAANADILALAERTGGAWRTACGPGHPPDVRGANRADVGTALHGSMQQGALSGARRWEN